MNCETFLGLLDAYIDGELSEAEKAAFLMHADTCENCKNELRNAEMLRSILADIDEDVAVPLEAQAAWRRAVREEAQKQNMRAKKRMWSRIAYAAAAVVLLIGAMFALGGDMLEPKQDMLQIASVENDGASDAEASAKTVAAGSARSVRMDVFGEVPADCAAWRKIGAADYALACETIEALAAEYSGTCAKEELNGEAMYTISLPQAYMAEFLSAASRIGTELEATTNDIEADTAIVCIHICKAA